MMKKEVLIIYLPNMLAEALASSVFYLVFVILQCPLFCYKIFPL